MAFCKANELGQHGEKMVKSIFTKAGINCHEHPENATYTQRLRSDLKCSVDGVNFGVEVKNDVMSKKTGNLAIEYYNTRAAKPSGIAATAAELWAVVLTPEVYLANTQELRSFFDGAKPLRDVHGGDDNSMMRLFKKDHILNEVFFRIDSLAPTDLVILVKTLLENNQ